MNKFSQLANLVGNRLEADAQTNPRTVGTKPAGGVVAIELSRITPDPDQPRKTFSSDEITDLAKSLKRDGQLEPIRVRYDAGSDRYVIVCGERRYRASSVAGLPTVLAIVEDRDLPRDRLTALQLIENALRADLEPIEAARAYSDLMDAWGCTQVELAQRLSISQSKVSRALALLTLPADVAASLAAGEVKPSQAVRQSPRKPRKPQTQSVTVSTPTGSVVVKPKPGQTVESVLVAALKERKAAA